MMKKRITKLRDLFRSKGPIGATQFILIDLNYRYHKFFEDTLFDWKYDTETSLIEKEYLDSPEIRRSEDFQFYQAVRWGPFRRMIRSLPERSLDDFGFVDVGCGKGRALLFASLVGFREIIGVELSPRLCAMAEANIVKFRDKTNAKAAFDVVHCEAKDFMIPSGNQVIMLCNPFVGETMRLFINSVADSYRKYQRTIYILYRNPVCHDIISGNEAIHTMQVNGMFAAYRVEATPTTKGGADHRART